MASLALLPFVVQAGQAPLARDILGCYGKFEDLSNHTLIARFVARTSDLGGVYRRSYQNNKELYAAELIQIPTKSSFGTRGLGVGEGTDQLPRYREGNWEEHWTYPSPAGTFFTARGNFAGFFLYDASSENNDIQTQGLFVYQEGLGNEEKMILNCTNSLETLKTWRHEFLSLARRNWKTVAKNPNSLYEIIRLRILENPDFTQAELERWITELLNAVTFPRKSKSNLHFKLGSFLMTLSQKELDERKSHYSHLAASLLEKVTEGKYLSQAKEQLARYYLSDVNPRERTSLQNQVIIEGLSSSDKPEDQAALQETCLNMMYGSERKSDLVLPFQVKNDAKTLVQFCEYFNKTLVKN